MCVASLALFHEVIALAIIFLFVGLAVLRVLIIATRTILVSIVLMTIVGLLVVSILLVASMIVMILVALMLLVAQLTAMHGGKISHLLFFWLLFVLGDLLKNASRSVGCLTLLKESNELERVHGHCLICIRECGLGYTKKNFHSSLALWVSPLFDGGSHHQDS